MKTGTRTTAVLVGALSAAAMMLSAHTVFAAVTWGGSWSSETVPGTMAECWGGWSGEYVGKSIINGTDLGQVVAWCERGNSFLECGTQSGFAFYVRGRGRDTATNTTESTASSSGNTVFSTAGGNSLEFHQCQKGYEPIP